MEMDDTSRLPRPHHFLWAGLLAIGLLGLLALILPESYWRSAVPSEASSAPRQHVLVLVVDSTEQFDAHGAYVHSVIQRYCQLCEVRQINVHGNMNTSTLQLALGQVQAIVRTVDQTTSVIINLSWGTYTYDAVMHATIRELHALGAVVIASAGNDNTSKHFYPAAFDEVLGICSSSRYRKSKAAYSNFGPWVSLCAPGLHYVSRPLQHGGIASGTSFASPMVSGVLGQRLLDAPCATPEAGVQALLRTTEPLPDEPPIVATGELNRDAAAHYLKTLYACGAQPRLGSRILQALRRVSSNVMLFIGLLTYAIVSIFALPFLFAYILERFRLRAEQRLKTTLQMAYAESTRYRSQRLDVLKQRLQQTGRLRYREEAELMALLHAQYVFDEPCGWCEGQQRMLTGEAALLVGHSPAEAEQLSVCARCGLKPEASTLSL